LTTLTNGIVTLDDTIPKVETITQEQLDHMVEMLAWCKTTLHPNYLSMQEANHECHLQNKSLEKENELEKEKYEIAHKEQRKQRFWKHVYMIGVVVEGTIIIGLILLRDGYCYNESIKF